jgi:hypothetical protein
MAKKGPCWEGYEMVGMKTKNGRKVPNCVPKTTKAYNGKFIQHDSADIKLSNPSLVSYYGDLLK